MPLGLLGKKLGQTRVYDANGVMIPVTVVLAGPNRVLQCKTQAGKDGYNAVQLGFDDQKEQRLTKPLLGHIKKLNGAAGETHPGVPQLLQGSEARRRRRPDAVRARRFRGRHRRHQGPRL